MPATIISDNDGARLRGIAVYRLACDAGDPIDLSAPLAASGVTAAAPVGSVPVPSPRATNGATTLYVGSTFNASGATAVLTVVLWQLSGSTYYLLPGLQTATATASSTARVSATGDYVGGLLAFDLAGASHYEVRVANPSGTANVDLFCWEA